MASVELIEEGLVYGTMAQFPSVMGSKAVELLVGVLNGTVDPASVDKFIDSGTDCFTLKNIDKAKEFAF